MSTGTIFDIKKFAIHDGPGVRTTVFLKGCPLSCWFCHNPEGQSSEVELLLRSGRCNRCGDCVDCCPRDAITLNEEAVQIDRYRCDLCGACVDVCLPGALELAGREVSVGEVMAEVEQDVVYYDQSGGGVTFSGGEPLAQPSFLLALLRACRERGIRTALDTSGYAAPGVFRRIAGHVDLFLYDLKLMSEERHREFTGVSVAPIHDNLRWLSEQNASVVVRFPLLPGINDDGDNLRAIGEFLSSLAVLYPLDILPYHRMGVDKYVRLDRGYRMPDLEPPSRERLGAVVGQLSGYGLRVTVRGEERWA